MSIKELTIIENHKKVIENIFEWQQSEYIRGQHDLCCQLIKEIEQQNNEEIEEIRSKSVLRRIAIQRVLK